MLLDLRSLAERPSPVAEELPPRAPTSARSFLEDALPFAALILASFGAWDDPGPVHAPTLSRALLEESYPLDGLTIVPPPEIQSFLEPDAAPRAPWGGQRAVFDEFFGGPLRSTFVDTDGARSGGGSRRVGVEDAAPLSPLDQNDVVSFLADERVAATQHGRARAFDTFPEERILAPFLGEDGAPKSPWRSARASDTFPEKRVLDPFLDEQGVIRSVWRTVPAESVEPVAPLDVNEVVSFLDDERLRPWRRSSREAAEDAFVPLRVLAPHLADEGPFKGPWRVAQASDTFPENPVLAPFLDETGTPRLVLRTAAIEDTATLGPLDVNEVVSFLNDERVAVTLRIPSRAFDTFPENAVLAPILADEGPFKSPWRAAQSSDTFPEKAVLAPFLDEAEIRSRIIRSYAEETDALPPLDQNDVVAFLDDERLAPPTRQASLASDTFPEKPLLKPFLDEEGRISTRLSRALLEETDLSPLDQNEVASFLDDEIIRRPTRTFFNVDDELPLPRLLSPFLDEAQPHRTVLRFAQVEELFPLSPVLAPIAPFFPTDEVTQQRRHPIILIDSAAPETPLELAQLLSFLNQDVPHPSAFTRPRTAETTFQDARLSPPPPPPPPTPPKPKPVLTRRSSSGGGGGGGGSDRRPIEWRLDPKRLYVHFPDPKEAIEPEADYALMISSNIRALANGVVSHFKDAHGHLALRLEADDGTNYYYANLSRYVGVGDRRVTAGETIAKSAREAVPKITPAARLPAMVGGVPPKLQQARVVTPVLVELPVKPPPPPTPPRPPRMFVRLVPIAAPPPSALAGVLQAPERSQGAAIALVVGIGALVALLFALSRAPKRPKPKKSKRRPRRLKR